MKDTKKYYVYMVRCNDNSLYTGYTVNNLKKRIRAHNEKKGAKYTRSRIPVKLAYYEIYCNLSDALKREIEIKKLSKLQKESLITKKFLKP